MLKWTVEYENGKKEIVGEFKYAKLYRKKCLGLADVENGKIVSIKPYTKHFYDKEVKKPEDFIEMRKAIPYEKYHNLSRKLYYETLYELWGIGHLND